MYIFYIHINIIDIYYLYIYIYIYIYYNIESHFRDIFFIFMEFEMKKLQNLESIC